MLIPMAIAAAKVITIAAVKCAIKVRITGARKKWIFSGTR